MWVLHTPIFVPTDTKKRGVGMLCPHLQGLGFDSHIYHVFVEFIFSPFASGVSSGYSKSKDMRWRPIGISKLLMVCDYMCDCAL